MTIKIAWVAPEDTNIGSVLIYRSTDNVADNLGSRTIIDTIAAASGGNWVTTYTDTSGNEDHVYRIQFWDGSGSSFLSDPITVDYSELLAELSEVKRAAKINDNSDVGSDEIFDAINDATHLIWDQYGDPIMKTVVYVDSSGSPKYDFTGNNKPVYQVRKVTVGTSEETTVPLGSYTINKRDGIVEFDSTFLSNNEGDYIWLEWVPETYHQLCKFTAALDLIEAGKIIDGRLVETPDARRITRRLVMLKETLRPKVITSDELASVYESVGDGFGHNADYIGQKIDRRSLPPR